MTTTESREAVAMVNQEQPDVLLLDIMMPHVSGLDILAALRADRRWAHLPVVILTAANDQRPRGGGPWSWGPAIFWASRSIRRS